MYVSVSVCIRLYANPNRMYAFDSHILYANKKQEFKKRKI